MTLIDLTNVRDVTVVDPSTGSASTRSVAGRADCGCHGEPIEPGADLQEPGRG